MENAAAVQKPAGPFLRWAGSKRQLIPILRKLAGIRFDRYVEPFVGSACLFFALAPRRALLGDVNAELMGTFTAVRDAVDEVLEELGAMEKNKDFYLLLRSTAPETLSPASRAARFIYLNRCCFNGLYRTNRKGLFNVPYGGDRSGQLPGSDHLRACSRALACAELFAGDFDNVLRRVGPGDFVYMDPPFSVRSHRVFNEYDASLFDTAALQRLRGWMELLANRGIRFVVSYADCEEASILKAGFECSTVAVKRNIAGFVSERRSAAEVLIANRV